MFAFFTSTTAGGPDRAPSPPPREGDERAHARRNTAEWRHVCRGTPGARAPRCVLRCVVCAGCRLRACRVPGGGKPRGAPASHPLAALASAALTSGLSLSRVLRERNARGRVNALVRGPPAAVPRRCPHKSLTLAHQPTPHAHRPRRGGTLPCSPTPCQHEERRCASTRRSRCKAGTRAAPLAYTAACVRSLDAQPLRIGHAIVVVAAKVEGLGGLHVALLPSVVPLRHGLARSRRRR
jgi:hypothetical protein